MTASIAITGVFSQARDLILAAFAVWLGICVFAAKLLDGYRAYAAVLSGYTVALVAAQQIDHPQHVFESGMARGAAIAVGILSIAVVNTLIFAPTVNAAGHADSSRRFIAAFASMQAQPSAANQAARLHS